MTVFDEYLNALLLFIDATSNDDRKKARKFYTLVDRAFRQLRDSGRLGELTALLSHANDQVKLWAATHILPFDEKLATDFLSKMAEDDLSLVGFDAKMTLQEWRKGNLTYLIE